MMDSCQVMMGLMFYHYQVAIHRVNKYTKIGIENKRGNCNLSCRSWID